MTTPRLKRSARSGRRRQRGSVAVIVALSAVALFGFAGLALDSGRLYLNKTELQSAADACALAAAAELVCNPAGGACPASYLLNAQAAGIFAAGRNKRDFQRGAVTIAAADVKFHTALAPNADYRSQLGGASTSSRYAMCTARAAGITPWIMTMLGAGAQAVAATGVATLAPAKTFCNSAPIGICQPAVAYAVGEWIPATFQTNGNNETVTGGFKWVEYTPTSVIRSQLVGSQTVCGVRIGDSVTTQGTHQGAKSAYNTRFGLYPNGANAYTAATAPPDHTGYAYPTAAIGVGTSAFVDYKIRQGRSDPFSSGQYTGGNAAGNVSSVATHEQFGADRRIVMATQIDCAAGNTPPILGMSCLLMLNPMSNGANGTIYLEYLGVANSAGSPCRTGGAVGGPASNGPQVPALVQ